MKLVRKRLLSFIRPLISFLDCRLKNCRSGLHRTSYFDLLYDVLFGENGPGLSGKMLILTFLFKTICELWVRQNKMLKNAIPAI